MAANLDNLMDGTGIRFERGRAVEGRRVFQRIYTAGLSGLAEMLNDYTLPSTGDAYDAGYPDLLMVDADLKVISTDRATGASVCRITCDYVDTNGMVVQGGSTTASVQTAFDSDGNRISVSRAGDEYVALIEVEEARSYAVIERTQFFAPEVLDITTYIKGIVNTVNAATFLGEPARCWRVARIEHELLFETVAFGTVVQNWYRVRYYIEHRPTRDIELIAGESLTTVAGWDSIIAYEADGVIPADAVFQVVQRYAESDFDTVFAGVTF